MNLSQDQYCYVYLKHKDNFINKTIIAPSDGFLKLIGISNENLIFSNTVKEVYYL